MSLFTSFSAPYAARPGRGKQRVQFVETPTIAGPSSSSVPGGEAVVEVCFLSTLSNQFGQLERATSLQQITGWEKGTEDELKELILTKTKVQLRNVGLAL